MDEFRLNYRLRSLVDCVSYRELTQELHTLLEITQSNCGENWVVDEIWASNKMLEKASMPAQSLNEAQNDNYWTEFILFARDLLLTVSKQYRSIGYRTINNISESNMRKLQFGYWPPELFRGEEVCEKSHVYTFGAFLIHLITEHPPFSNYDYPQLLYNVGSGKLLLEPPTDCHPLIASLIVECCRFNVKKRLSFQALYDRFFSAHND